MPRRLVSVPVSTSNSNGSLEKRIRPGLFLNHPLTSKRKRAATVANVVDLVSGRLWLLGSPRIETSPLHNSLRYGPLPGPHDQTGPRCGETDARDCASKSLSSLITSAINHVHCSRTLNAAVIPIPSQSRVD